MSSKSKIWFLIVLYLLPYQNQLLGIDSSLLKTLSQGAEQTYSAIAAYLLPQSYAAHVPIIESASLCILTSEIMSPKQTIDISPTIAEVMHSHVLTVTNELNHIAKMIEISCDKVPLEDKLNAANQHYEELIKNTLVVDKARIAGKSVAEISQEIDALGYSLECFNCGLSNQEVWLKKVKSHYSEIEYKYYKNQLPLEIAPSPFDKAAHPLLIAKNDFQTLALSVSKTKNTIDFIKQSIALREKHRADTNSDYVKEVAKSLDSLMATKYTDNPLSAIKALKKARNEYLQKEIALRNNIAYEEKQLSHLHKKLTIYHKKISSLPRRLGLLGDKPKDRKIFFKTQERINSTKNNIATSKNELNHQLPGLITECESLQTKYQQKAKDLTIPPILVPTQYTLSDIASNFVRSAGKNPTEFFSCSGTAEQQSTHREIIHLVEKTAALTITKNTSQVKEEILHYACLAKEYNNSQQTSLAKAAHKVGDTLFEYAKEVLDLGVAFIEGAIQGIDTTGKTFQSIAHAIHMPANQKIEKVTRLITSCAQALGNFVKEQYHAVTSEEGLRTWETNRERRGRQFAQFSHDLEQRYAQSTLRDKVKWLTAFILENRLLGKTVEGVLSCSRLINVESQAITLLEKELHRVSKSPMFDLKDIDGIARSIHEVTQVALAGSTAEKIPIITNASIEKSVKALTIASKDAQKIDSAVLGLAAATKPLYIDLTNFKPAKTGTQFLADNKDFCSLIQTNAKPGIPFDSIEDVANRLALIHPKIAHESELISLVNKYKHCPGFMGHPDSPFERIMNVGEGRFKIKNNISEDLLKASNRLEGLKGPLFELRLAEQLETQGMKITEFGAKYWPNGIKGSRGTSPLDFDLATVDTLIEAKNRKFACFSENDIADLIDSIIKHRDTAVNVVGKKYLFISGELLPELLKQKLTENNIDFIEVLQNLKGA